ncbi:copia protein [Tanacetum coccineum]
MADVRRLSAHVIKLRDMPEGVLVLSRLSHVWKSRVCDPVLRGADGNEEPHLDVRPTFKMNPFYCTPPVSADAVISDPTLEDLAVGTPNSKILAKAEASQKRKASTSGATLSHVAKRTRSALAQSSGNSWGKGIMADDAAASFVGVSRPRPSSGPIPSFRDVSRMAIHADIFPFSAGPYYATYLEGGVTGNCEFTREEWDASYRPTFVVLSKEVFKDPVVCKTVVDQFPTPGEMVRSKAKGKERKKKIKSLTKSLDNLHAKVARLFTDLNRATILEAEKDEEILHLEATPPKFSSFFRGQFQGLSGSFLLLMSLAEFRKMANFLHGAHDRLAEASLLIAQTDYAFLNKISDHATEPLSVLLQIEPEKLAGPDNIPISRDARVSPSITKESTVTSASKSLELSTNVAPASFVVALEQNEEWVNAMVDGPDAEKTDGVAPSKSRSVFVQGIYHVLDDVAEVTAVGSKRVSSGPTDVVVALSVGEKGDGSLPSSAVDEEAVANPNRVLCNVIQLEEFEDSNDDDTVTSTHEDEERMTSIDQSTMNQSEEIYLATSRFESNDDLLKSVRAFYYGKGYGLSIRNSKKDQYVTLQCDLSGVYQDKRSVGTKRKKNTGSRLTDCPFQIKGSGYQQKDRKPSQNDKTEHGMEKTVQNQGQSPKMPKSESILKNQQSNRSRN